MAFFAADHIISPLGFSTEENLRALENKQSGIKKQYNKNISGEAFYAAMLDEVLLGKAFQKIGHPKKFTKLEKMMLLAVDGILKQQPELCLKKTALIVSTTKGNIDLLGENLGFPKEKVKLYELGKTIARFFNFENRPITLSNACISGGLAIAIGKRFIESGKYDHALVVGGDLVSEFTFSGFTSFQAISKEPCKPYSKNRSGITLGEAAAAVLLENSKLKIQNLPDRQAGSKSQTFPAGRRAPNHPPHTSPSSLKPIFIAGAASANDANHISGPSRDGEGLFLSIENALKEAKTDPAEIDFISPHGTGTLFNDEMEAIAFDRAALLHVPITSLKGFYGHTLGASALLETIVAKRSLENNILYPSLGCSDDSIGVSKSIKIQQEVEQKNLTIALKTASGFGGCNVALVLQKGIQNKPTEI